MNSTDTTSARPRRGTAEKRNALLKAARGVFGRDGYARASIDAIAAEAGVSTRTLYNHFGGKEALFTETLGDSATEVAEAQTGLVRKHLDQITDVETGLIEFGYDLVTSGERDEFADHFAMVRQIRAEAAHFPQDALEAWQEAGPRAVQRELARRFAHLQDRGLLRPAPPERMVGHYLALVSSGIPQGGFGGPEPMDDAEVREAILDAVRAFLTGYTA